MQSASINTPLRVVARSGILLGASAASIVAVASFSFHQGVSLLLLVAIGALTVSSYAIDRIFDEARRQTHSRSTLLRFIALAALAFAIAEACLLSRGHATAALLAMAFPASVVLYTIPLIGQRRVKDLPLVKPLYTAAMWGLLVVLTASTAARAEVSTICALGFLVFGKLVIGVIASDIKDTRFDRMDNVQTFPVVFGVERVLSGLQLWNILCMSVTVVAVWLHVLPAYMLAAELHGVLVLLLLRRMQHADCQEKRWLISEVFLDASYVALFPLAKLGAFLISG